MTHTATSHGRTFRIVEGTVHPAYSLNCFDEERAFREAHFTPSAGDVVVDVGASYGSYTLPALACGAQVVALEPEPKVFCDLVRNVAANDWQPMATLLNLGAWSDGCSQDMRQYAKHWPAQTISCAYRMIALDSLRLDRCDWLKIDVEGAEGFVVTGARETIRRCQPRVVIECHTFIEADMVERIKAKLPGYEFEEIAREPCVMLVGRARG